jgi:uncharacterized protein
MRASPAAGLVVAMLCGVGCVPLKRTPAARHFFLRAVADPPRTLEPREDSVLVGVLPVVLPAYLDRPQIVTGAGPGELRIDEFLRWAEPLEAGVTRTLVEDLQTLLPNGRVLQYPWSAQADLQCRVRVELSVFGPQANGEVRLEGHWTLLPSHEERPRIVRSARFARGPVSLARADAGDAVEAMSGLVAQLAGQIAEAQRTLILEANPPQD